MTLLKIIVDVVLMLCGDCMENADLLNEMNLQKKFTQNLRQV